MAFFKKRSTDSEQTQEPSINETEVKESAGAEHQEDGFVSEKEQPVKEKEYARPQTRLVLPQGKDELPNELRYVMQFIHSELPPIEEGTLSIDGYKLEQGTFGFTLTAFLRNNTEEAIFLTFVPLVLFDADNNLIARRVFNLDAVEMEPKTALPYQFEFYPEHFTMNSFDLSSWYVAFHMHGDEFRAVTPIEPFETREDFSIQNQVEKEYRQARAHALNILEETQGQINFIRGGFAFSEAGNLAVELYIRNGREEEVSLPDNLVCTVLDTQGDEVASASFDLSGVLLPPSSVTLYTLEYDKNLIRKENPDLSDWSIRVEG
ncbi:SLAP domain-containing protein [Aneurinibacillus tyrosinisolvens]|uniref:SLAP domain-containing protein n=1 Tax=Aneurinibacillus tyrosinisolvens TaxID=1443435 RepID=UPI00063EFEDF|nr:SLAP domain-containing protein [Aneurinibacillus tyrosinisolvens]